MPLTTVRATPTEVARPLPGDDLVDAEVVMDRAFTLPAAPSDVWQWLVQLGKSRAGWYLPRSVERFLPRRRRASLWVEARWQNLRLGDVVPDYGGPDATFIVALLEPGKHLVYRSQRGRTTLSWAIVLAAVGDAETRVHLRLRLAPVKHRRLAEIFGGLVDALSIAGMAAGLRERLA